MTWKTLIAGLAVPAAMVAAPQTGPRSQLQNTMEKLELSADQKAKLTPIVDEDAKQVRALRGDSRRDGQKDQADSDRGSVDEAGTASRGTQAAGRREEEGLI